MLKLNKSTSSRDIHISIRERERYFTRSFLIAFGIAITFHLLFITIFHVAPFILRINQTVFPPTYIENVPFQDAMTLANADQIEVISSHLPPPLQSVPQLPNSPSFSNFEQRKWHNKSSSEASLFYNIEQQIYTPTFSPLAITTPLFHVKTTGVLAEKFRLKSDWEKKHRPPITQESYAIYEVVVEGNSGRIFWFEPKQLTHNPALNQFATTLLSELRFETDQSIPTASGNIEMHFYPNGSYD